MRNLGLAASVGIALLSLLVRRVLAGVEARLDMVCGWIHGREGRVLVVARLRPFVLHAGHISATRRVVKAKMAEARDGSRRRFSNGGGWEWAALDPLVAIDTIRGSFCGR
jgi:hypothetical protein